MLVVLTVGCGGIRRCGSGRLVEVVVVVVVIVVVQIKCATLRIGVVSGSSPKRHESSKLTTGGSVDKIWLAGGCRGHMRQASGVSRSRRLSFFGSFEPAILPDFDCGLSQTTPPTSSLNEAAREFDVLCRGCQSSSSSSSVFFEGTDADGQACNQDNDTDDDAKSEHPFHDKSFDGRLGHILTQAFKRQTHLFKLS